MSTTTMTFKIDHGSNSPLHRQLRSCVETAVESGTLKSGDRIPSIRAISQETGLAYATVSRAVRELVEQGVLVARAGAGTRVADGPIATPNNQEKTGMIGVVSVLSLTELHAISPYFREVLMTVQDEVVRHGLCVCYDRWNTIRPIHEMFGHMSKIDGLVLFASADLGAVNVEDLLSCGIPSIAVGSGLDHQPVQTIHSDNVADSRETVEQLIAMGHRHIAYATSQVSELWDDDRYEGYCQAMTAHGLDPKANVCIRQYGVEVARSIIAATPRPTAVLVAAGIHEFPMALPLLYQAGIHIGRDLTVAAYDESHFGTLSDMGVPFMRVRQPVRRIAESAVANLLQRIAEPDADFSSRLLLRSEVETVGNLPTIGNDGH